MSSTHSTTAATSSDWKTLVQKTVAFDAAAVNAAVSGTMRSSLTERSLHALRLDVVLLEVLQRAGMIGDVVVLIERGSREFAQGRLDGDDIRLVLLQRVDEPV